MKLALNEPRRDRLYRLVRRWIQRNELQPVIFDRYVDRSLSLEDALDDYMAFHFEGIMKDLAMLLRKDRDRRAGIGDLNG